MFTSLDVYTIGRDDNIKFTSKSEIQQIFDNLDDWKSQFTELVDKSSRLVESCLNFGLNKPKFAGLDALVDDLNNTTKSWDLLKVKLRLVSLNSALFIVCIL